MNFKIEDILNGTVDGISIETITTMISEVIESEEDLETRNDVKQ